MARRSFSMLSLYRPIENKNRCALQRFLRREIVSLLVEVQRLGRISQSFVRHCKIEHGQGTFGRERLGCPKRRNRQFEIVLHVVKQPEEELCLFGCWISRNGRDKTALGNIRTMRKLGQPGLEDQGWNHVRALMQSCIDFANSLGKFPLRKILFCVLVMLRWADCELECEKPDHRSLPPGARE